MNATKMLKQDHDKVKTLFKEYEATGDHAYQTKRNIAEKIFSELEVHTAIEEEIFYPAVEAKANKEGKELVKEAIEEHRVAKMLIDDLSQLDAQDEQFDAKMKVLMDNVKHHIEEEESEMFAQAKKYLSDDLENLGIEMEVQKEDMLGISRTSQRMDKDFPSSMPL